ncbi:hypothetical protein EDB19DRAFT_1746753 [Suillus lakei]|nr:hypothetical protein EDB19DRAFT_1746753 [Suillus lakei]
MLSPLMSVQLIAGLWSTGKTNHITSIAPRSRTIHSMRGGPKFHGDAPGNSEIRKPKKLQTPLTMFGKKVKEGWCPR